MKFSLTEIIADGERHFNQPLVGFCPFAVSAPTLDGISVPGESDVTFHQHEVDAWRRETDPDRFIRAPCQRTTTRFTE